MDALFQCWHCHGDGLVAPTDKNSPDGHAWKEERCGECGGTGQVEVNLAARHVPEYLDSGDYDDLAALCIKIVANINPAAA